MVGRKSTSKLCSLSALDVKNDFEDEMERSWNSLQSKSQSYSSKKEIHDYLVSTAASSTAKFEEISKALLFGILTSNKEKAAEIFRDLTFVTSGTEAWMFTLTNLNFMVVEWWGRLLIGPREQIIWLMGEAIKTGVPNLDDVCVRAMRNIHGGDLSSDNLWLTDALLNIMLSNAEWMRGLRKSSLVPIAVYTYLRLICDHHGNTAFDGLRQKEIRFCVSILRERMPECMPIGRELVRLLLMLARIPEIGKLWTDILHKPNTFGPQFKSVWTLLEVRTWKKCVLQRIPVVMERELHFFLKQIRQGHHDRHMQWFQSKYLSKPESVTIRYDILRYLILYFDGTPDTFPRWAFIKSLLPNTLAVTESQFCKLCLFWDWIFYDPSSTDIRSIECVYSLMLNSLKTMPALSVTLLDFLWRLSSEILPGSKEKTNASVVAGFQALVEQNLTPSFAPLLEAKAVTDGRLRIGLRENFAELFTIGADPVPAEVQSEDSYESLQGAAFSDDEASSPPPQESVVEGEKEKEGVDSKSGGAEIEEEAGLEASLASLDHRLRSLIRQMWQSLSPEAMCEKVQALLITFLEDDELHEDSQMEALAECLCALFKEEFNRGVLLPPDHTDEASLEESLSSPVFMILRNACLSPDGDGTRDALIRLLGEMCLVQNKIGYYLLYLLRAGKELDDRSSPYTSLCEILDVKVGDALVKDLDLCQLDDFRLFGYLIPFVYQTFGQEAMSSPQLVGLIVSCIDGRQLRALVGELIQESFRMFKKDSFMEILKGSLEWDTIQQQLFWELVAADSVPIDWVLPLIPKLDEGSQEEACTSILLMIKRMDKEPNSGLLKALLTRDPSRLTDQLSTLSLKILIDDWPEKMVERLSSQLLRLANEYHKSVKKSAAKGLSLEYLLGHLDRLRMDCPKLLASQDDNFFGKSELQAALGKAKDSVPESLKNKYLELFTMMEILESLGEGGRSLRRGRATKTAAIKGKLEDESSDDDHSTSRSRPPRKKAKLMEEDSD